MVFMANTEKLEKPKKKVNVKLEDVKLNKDIMDKEGNIIHKKGTKLKKVEFEEVKQDDKNDTVSDGDKRTVQPRRTTLSPKERLSRR